MVRDQYILFDLGNVLIDWNPDYLYRNLIPNADRRKYFFDNVCTLEWHTDHDRGVSFAENAARLIRKHPDFQAEILAWHRRWPEQFGGYVSGMDALLQSLSEQRNIRLFGLSNLSAEVWNFMQVAFPVMALFEDVLISGQVGVIKPDPKIYALTWEMMGKPNKSNVYFIDDRQENIDAGLAFGFAGHCFKSRDNLAADLRTLPALKDAIV